MKKQTFKVGDTVYANAEAPLFWENEEIEVGKPYVVSQVCNSPMCGDYVQLEGIYSSYKFEWLIFIDRKRKARAKK